MNTNEILEAILIEQRAIRKLLETRLLGEAPTPAPSPVEAPSEVFPKGIHRGKTVSEVLVTNPEYIVFVYKTFCEQGGPKSKIWSVVTEKHFNAAQRALGVAKETKKKDFVNFEEDEAPPPRRKNKVPALPPADFDDVPF